MTSENFHYVLDRSPLFQSLGLSVVTLSADSVCLAIAESCPTHGGAFGDMTLPSINGAVLCAALRPPLVSAVMPPSVTRLRASSSCR